MAVVDVVAVEEEASVEAPSALARPLLPLLDVCEPDVCGAGMLTGSSSGMLEPMKLRMVGDCDMTPAAAAALDLCVWSGELAKKALANQTKQQRCTFCQQKPCSLWQVLIRHHPVVQPAKWSPRGRGAGRQTQIQSKHQSNNNQPKTRNHLTPALALGTYRSSTHKEGVGRGRRESKVGHFKAGRCREGVYNRGSWGWAGLGEQHGHILVIAAKLPPTHDRACASAGPSSATRQAACKGHMTALSTPTNRSWA